MPQENDTINVDVVAVVLVVDGSNEFFFSPNTKKAQPSSLKAILCVRVLLPGLILSQLFRRKKSLKLLFLFPSV